jgi:hypothetical protein
MDVTKDNWREYIRLVFLETLPSLLFIEEPIEDFRDGKLIYPSGWWSEKDDVFYKGRYVRRGENVFSPRSEGIWLAYSDKGGRVEWELPEGWKKLEVYRIWEDGRREMVRCDLKDGRFNFEAEEQGVYEVIKG